MYESPAPVKWTPRRPDRYDHADHHHRHHSPSDKKHHRHQHKEPQEQHHRVTSTTTTATAASTATTTTNYTNSTMSLTKTKRRMPCAEMVTFRLTDDTTKTAFLKASRKTVDVVEAFDGFISRSLSVDDSGLWTDYVLWVDHDKAIQAAARIAIDPRFAALGRMIEPSSVSMRHATVEMCL